MSGSGSGNGNGNGNGSGSGSGNGNGSVTVRTEVKALNPRLRGLHARALDLSRKHRRLEWEIVQILQEVERTKLYKRLGCSSLFTYCVQSLGFTESVAYAFISVARKSLQVNELKVALQEQKLSVSKAHRLVSALTAENAKELLEFAATHSAREIEREVARRNPKAGPANQVRDLSEERVVVRVSMSRKTYEMWLRVQSLEAQRMQAPASLDAALGQALEFYLERKDPVRKARRKAERAAATASETETEGVETAAAIVRAAEAEEAIVTAAESSTATAIESRTELVVNAVAITEVMTMTNTVAPESAFQNRGELFTCTAGELPCGDKRPRSGSGPYQAQGASEPTPAAAKSQARVPLTAAQRHEVFARDGGRCTHVDARGRRCPEDKWLHIHHIRPISAGGSNDPSNLTLLCSFHHDLVHQLRLPITGQVSWLRSPEAEYGGSGMF
ncbi:MAG: HNH endonuclease [Bdellovibrionales bacterium]